MRRVIVLGGGFSGLLAAWRLHQRGFEVQVWEASDAPGGWARTLPWPGLRGEPGFLELGPQSLRVARGGALDRLLAELGLDLRGSGPKGPRWLGKGGKRHPSPASLTGLIRTPDLGWMEKLRLLAEPFVSRAPGSEDLRAFFARRLGEGFARELLPALVAGVFAAPPERIGMETLPRLKALEARGGLLIGGLRAGPEWTRVPAGGVGAVTAALAARLDVRLDRTATSLAPLPGGGWRVESAEASEEADAVVLALPGGPAAVLLRAAAPEAAGLLEAIPRLDLRVWHSRHPLWPGWERGFGLLIHPPEGGGLLGAVSFAIGDPRGVPGLMQVRTYLGGAYPVASALDAWPGVLAALRRWLPELPEAVQVREEPCPGAFPLLEPGHGARGARILGALPPGLHWLGPARFGPGLPDLAEGVEAWAAGLTSG
ncbi:NAD(P)/FAD-dependent oxidoreductase [Geothrix sp. 21YS21S-4]|uniref:protoporphyrinogen/coproporphyrinogen oxidase n=1 Tax=Geothrix sp. 21YS21S-4 TaxID=3068889 RepID=UPI0027B901D2|nr:FAD-dependent oxidoreductase [Geothrix sp. 21YS21S-4]